MPIREAAHQGNQQIHGAWIIASIAALTGFHSSLVGISDALAGSSADDEGDDESCARRGAASGTDP